MCASVTSNLGSTNQRTPTPDQVREIVIRELRAEKLTKAEQDALMQMTSEALMERATLALMKSAPPQLLIELSEEGKDPHNLGDSTYFMQRIAAAVPNAQTIVVDAIRAGLQDYQEYLEKEIGTLKQ